MGFATTVARPHIYAWIEKKASGKEGKKGHLVDKVPVIAAFRHIFHTCLKEREFEPECQNQHISSFCLMKEKKCIYLLLLPQEL